jgi:hypothetical protein
MKKNILLLAVLGFSVFSAFAAKTMVLFTSGNDSLRNLAALDSIKFSGASPSWNFLMHKGAGSTSTALTSIDSIRFYDGAAVLTPVMLFNAYTASPMKLTANNAAVTLDLRNLTSGFTGQIITDAIDILDTANAGISALASLSNATIATQAVVPSGAAIVLSYKTGDTYFVETGWTAWTAAPALNCELAGITGRYIKLRYVLTTNSASALPQISRVGVYGNFASLPSFAKNLTASSFQNERIVTSPYPYGWESRDQATVKSFTTTNNLAAVVAAKTNEFDKFYALTDWCARKPKGSYSWSTWPWDINQIYVGGSIKGHCMSYSITLITGLTGLGYYARHWAIQEAQPQPANNHEVVEVWSNTLKKWVYQDPSLDTYYADPVSGEPLSILQMHNINMTNGGITNVDGKYHYGVYTPTYNWQSLQGYTTCGFMMMTSRNNFHSQPAPAYADFGNGICGYNTFYCWIDNLTPTCDAANKFSGRVRDFWFTLNQASIKAKRGANNQLSLEFGNSQPFFKQYSIVVNGGAAVKQAGNTYTWTLNTGSNTIAVTPEDNWNTPGLPSTLAVTY